MTIGNQPSDKNQRTVPATCRTHRGCKGFCNLRLAKVNGEIVLDPHVAGCCVISLDETEARTVRDTLTEWAWLRLPRLGESPSRCNAAVPLEINRALAEDR